MVRQLEIMVANGRDTPWATDLVDRLSSRAVGFHWPANADEALGLAERLRPQTVDEVVGQRHLLGEGKPLWVALRSGRPHSMILWGPPGVGKSHAAKALAHLAVQRGYKVFYREAHVLIEEINEARELGEIRKYRAQMKAAELLVIDDLFLRKLPANAGDELADVIMGRYEKLSTIITSNRPVDDWAKLLGDIVVVTPLLDRLMHHGHLLKFDGKSWRLKEAAARVAKRAHTA